MGLLPNILKRYFRVLILGKSLCGLDFFYVKLRRSSVNFINKSRFIWLILVKLFESELYESEYDDVVFRTCLQKYTLEI